MGNYKRLRSLFRVCLEIAEPVPSEARKPWDCLVTMLPTITGKEAPSLLRLCLATTLSLAMTG